MKDFFSTASYRIPIAWSMILTFSLVAMFFFQQVQQVKTELKNLQHSCHTIALSKSTIFAKKMLTSAKLKRSWSLKGMFSETIHFRNKF